MKYTQHTYSHCFLMCLLKYFNILLLMVLLLRGGTSEIRRNIDREDISLICQGADGTKTLLKSQPSPSVIHRMNSRRKKNIEKSLETLLEDNPLSVSYRSSEDQRRYIQEMPYLLPAQEHQELKPIFHTPSAAVAMTACLAGSAAVAISANVNQITSSKMGKPAP